MKDAYEVLGVKETASKDEIKKRYDVLLKKHWMMESGQLSEANPEVSFEDINRAYNLIMGYDTGEKPENTKKANPLFKKLNLDEKKVNNFFYYYKVHMIVGIVVVLFLAFTLKGCVTAIKADLSVDFIGNFNYNQSDPLAQKIKNDIPGLKAAEVEIIPLTGNLNSQQEYAFQTKAMVVLSAGDVDVYIMDKVNFEKYGKQGVFSSLDDLAAQLNIDRNVNKDYILTSVNEKSEHLYGIDVSKSSVLKESGVIINGAIAGIRADAKHQENAVKLIKLLLK